MMGFVGFLKFCFDFLAWPLFALGYPLYASIRAIEIDSNSDMRNLVAYWIIFSLTSLFELAFVKLIEWLPFWPYMKLMAVCLLVLPHFNGACYVYECLIRPCLSVNPQDLIKYLNKFKSKEDLSLNGENFLAVAERYVNENGPEALEKLIDTKLLANHTMPNTDVEEIKAITSMEEKKMHGAIQSKFEEPNVTEEDVKAVEPTEKSPITVTKLPEFEETNVVNKNSKAGEVKDKNPAAVPEIVKSVQPALAQTEKKKFPAEEFKEETVEPSIPALENVQTEWTCATCQVTTTCERNLNSHLQGRKHKAKCEALKASKQATKNKGCSSSATNPETKKPISGDKPNQNKTKKQEENQNKAKKQEEKVQVNPNQNKAKKQEEKVQGNRASEQYKQKEVKNTGLGMNQFFCSICNVKCLSEIDMESHLKGKKHLARIQILLGSLGGV